MKALILTGASILAGCSTFSSKPGNMVGHCGVAASSNILVTCESYQIRCAKYGREKLLYCNYIIK